MSRPLLGVSCALQTYRQVNGHHLTSSGNGEGALDGTELLVGDERGVSRVTGVDLAGLEVTDDILRQLALSDSGLLFSGFERYVPCHRSSSQQRRPS